MISISERDGDRTGFTRQSFRRQSYEPRRNFRQFSDSRKSPPPPLTGEADAQRASEGASRRTEHRAQFAPPLPDMYVRVLFASMRAPTKTVVRARALRKEMSPPEVRLWLRLRKRDNGEPKFRRQHPIGSYILDFYCPAARLALEVDGEGHHYDHKPAYDARRDAWLKAQGIRVVRVSAEAVFEGPFEIAERAQRLAAAMINQRALRERAGGSPPLAPDGRLPPP